MHSLATIQTSVLTVAQKRSLEAFYRAFSDKNPSLLDEAVTSDWQDIPLAPGQGSGSDGFKPLMQMFFTTFPANAECNDYGKDLLRQHYQQHSHPHRH